MRSDRAFPHESPWRTRQSAYKLLLLLDLLSGQPLSCSGGSVAFRDLYDLLQWTEHCSPDQLIRLADGIYHVTLCSDVPASGILGDNQVIDVYLNQLDRFPALAKTGIPTLCM